MEPPRLLHLAIKTVYENLERYDEELLKTCIGPVREKMLEEVLQRAKDHSLKCHIGEKYPNDKIWAILPCLIKSKFRTKMDTGMFSSTSCDFYTWPNSRFQELIRCLGANTPNLMELKIESPFGCDHSLEERELASIIQLKNLTILEINRVVVPLSGILDISRRCEKLKKIIAKSVAIDEVPTPALIRDDFVYVHIEASILSVGFISLHMETTNSTKNYSLSLSHEPIYIREFSLAQLFAQKLQAIHIDCFFLEDTEEMVEFPHLPVIEYAKFVCDGKSTHALKRFMRRNGETLQELRLSGIRSKEKMTFSKIFIFCPHLQSLELVDCYLHWNDAPVYAMQQLKRFFWSNEDLSYSHHVVAFSSILSAPLLEDLCIGLRKINFSDNASVIARIQSREILQNLKKLLMPNRIDRSLDDYSSHLKSFTDLRNAIRSVIRVIPA